MARAVKPARKTKTKLAQQRPPDYGVVWVTGCATCGGSHEFGRCPSLTVEQNLALTERRLRPPRKLGIEPRRSTPAQ